MKFLIQNYARNSFTEPLYICETINKTKGSECTMWSNDASAFDIFDIVQPEVFFTHYSILDNDTLKYLSKNKKTSLVLNVTGAHQDHINMLEDIISTKKINCPLLFTNQPSKLKTLLQKKTKLVSVMHGADLFLANQNPQGADYSIETAILTNHKPKGGADFDTYHILSHEEELAEDVDLVAPAMHMFSLYRNYKRVIVTHDSKYVPQSFFDAILYGHNAYYFCSDSTQADKMKEVIGSLFPEPTCGNLFWGGSNETEDGSARSVLLNKHTCLHRTKRLFQQLKCADVAKDVDELIQGGHK